LLLAKVLRYQMAHDSGSIRLLAFGTTSHASSHCFTAPHGRVCGSAVVSTPWGTGEGGGAAADGQRLDASIFLGALVGSASNGSRRSMARHRLRCLRSASVSRAQLSWPCCSSSRRFRPSFSSVDSFAPKSLARSAEPASTPAPTQGSRGPGSSAKVVVVPLRRGAAVRPKREPTNDEEQQEHRQKELITFPSSGDEEELHHGVPHEPSEDTDDVTLNKGTHSNRCDVICLADDMDLDRINSAWEQASEMGVVPTAKIRRLGADVCVLEMDDGRLCFTFGFGSVVCWGFTWHEFRRVRRLLRRSLPNILPPEDMESDWLYFKTAQDGVESLFTDVTSDAAVTLDDEKPSLADSLADALAELEDSHPRKRQSQSGAPVGLEDSFSQTHQAGVLEELRKAIADVKSNAGNSITKLVHNGEIRLTTATVDEALAYSYALAQSVKLSVFEKLVDNAIETAKPIPEALAQHGVVTMDDTIVNRQMGEIFVTKCSMTLQSDILDTPEIIWEDDRFDEQYNVGRKYLELGKRVDILNQRLTVLNDLYSFLQAQLEVKQANKLEWIIIVLIVLEILVDLFNISSWYSDRNAKICGGLLIMSGAVAFRKKKGQGGNSMVRWLQQGQQIIARARQRWWRPLSWVMLGFGCALTVRGIMKF